MKVGEKIRNWLKTDLCEDLERLRINTRGKTIKEVQQMAESRNIPIKVEEDGLASQKAYGRCLGSVYCWIQQRRTSQN